MMKIQTAMCGMDRICSELFRRLTVSEKAIALGIHGGAKDDHIAALLRVKTRTVRFHVASIFRKTGCRSRTDVALLVDRANRHDLSEVTGLFSFSRVQSWVQRIKKLK